MLSPSNSSTGDKLIIHIKQYLKFLKKWKRKGKREQKRVLWLSLVFPEQSGENVKTAYDIFKNYLKNTKKSQHIKMNMILRDRNVYWIDFSVSVIWVSHYVYNLYNYGRFANTMVDKSFLAYSRPQHKATTPYPEHIRMTLGNAINYSILLI